MIGQKTAPRLALRSVIRSFLVYAVWVLTRI